MLGFQCVANRVWIGNYLCWGDPDGGAHEIGYPDFLKRHIKRHGESLIDNVVFLNFENGVFATQKMADVSLADYNSLRSSCGARGVNDVSWVGCSAGADGAARGAEC